MISISHVLRPMRGGSQSRTVQGDDGLFYVCKWFGNPQGNRTLINELISFRLLESIGVSTPKLRLLFLPEQLRKQIRIQLGHSSTSPSGRIHLGSEYAADPKKAIFDFLPDRLLPKVRNLAEFATMLVFDKWLHCTDKRQAVFYRDQTARNSVRFKASFIDHGMAFGGERWELGDAPFHGLAMPHSIYKHLNLKTLIDSEIGRIQSITRDMLFSSTSDVPVSWFTPRDNERLPALLTQLESRQASLDSLIKRHLRELDL